ncbi:MAG TPA: cyclic pyranopterin monophosphate synthase MoaC [Candidatus Omnitrophica bacterium]|nr:MAG: molybdenum cofactor biosynthesis protein C [Omnitrophica WOR_2 bacterium GWA2_45_18]HBR13952.1 cyclic pyranopterin monophosphate synthase MoaC [Candidatus Omnitrophota bacterium]
MRLKHTRKQIHGMVDISGKSETTRTAVAASRIQFTPEAFKTLIDEGSPKGDVLETAKIAGIMAAKSTPSIIPMCHPLELSKVQVTFEVDKKALAVVARAEVVCLGRTGVEMEALTAAAAAALTIYDMMKWKDKGMIISEIKLLSKSGGKSGDYHRT